MATRTTRKSARTSARRASPAKRSAARSRTRTAAHTERASKDYAHGYSRNFLKREPKSQPEADAILDDIWARLQVTNATFPGTPPKLSLSLMEDTPSHKKGKPGSRNPGKELFLFVAFNPVPPGYDVAHDHIHDLDATINSNSNVAQGLGNHFCCYSDRG